MFGALRHLLRARLRRGLGSGDLERGEGHYRSCQPAWRRRAPSFHWRGYRRAHNRRALIHELREGVTGLALPTQGLVEKYQAAIPKYPEVYDYYRMNRLILVGGVPVPSPQSWNDGLAKLNAEVGPLKQANVIVVLVKDLPRSTSTPSKKRGSAPRRTTSWSSSG